jgi:hypothetical protein
MDMKPMSRLLTLATFALLTGCEGGQDLSLVCKGSDAYGVTQFGTLGPWVMTKSGPMVGDIRGVAVGEPIPCQQAEKLLGLKAEAWPSLGGKG